ncbi:hypothetical protein CZ771_09490 [Actinomycetales bacterium JB111]|nr:hypothetical protein CZ771_09490 [Actinomycetales bacterium JB111]
MSTIDPSTRWWRSRRLWGTVSMALILGGVLLTVVNGWVVARSMRPPYVGTSVWQTIVLAMLPLPMALGGLFIHAFGTRGEDDRVGRRLAYPIIGLVSGIGVGHVAYDIVHSLPLTIWPVCMVVAGLLAVVILEIILRRTYAKEAVEQEVQRSGVKGRGEITRAVTYYLDHSPVTRVTVTFVDHGGVRRYARGTIGGHHRSGTTIPLTYSPTRPEVRGGVVLGVG